MALNVLDVEDLTVAANNRTVLRGIHLQIKEGEIHVLFGPNGSGKTCLLMALMGLPRYKVVKGRIVYRGEDVTMLRPDERAQRGMGIFYQRPPTVSGLRLGELVELSLKPRSDGALVAELARRLDCSGLLAREVNKGFSGGEIKKSELLQLAARRPVLALVDEPDSGVDVDNLALIGRLIWELLREENRQSAAHSALLVTHTGQILTHVRADRAHVLVSGAIVNEGAPGELLQSIRAHGYREWLSCRA